MEQARRYHFLVLEDEKDDAFLIKRAFLKSSFPVTACVCRNVAEAKAYLSQAGIYARQDQFPPPDGIIAELHMAGEDGMDFLTWVREQAPLRDLPFVMMSGSSNPIELERCRALGATGVFTKPSTFPELALLIERLAKEGCPA